MPNFWIQIYSDIRSYQDFDKHIFGYSFVSIFRTQLLPMMFLINFWILNFAYANYKTEITKKNQVSWVINYERTLPREAAVWHWHLFVLPPLLNCYHNNPFCPTARPPRFYIKEMTGETPEELPDCGWTLFEHQLALTSTIQLQSAPISINLQEWESISINQN